MFENYPKKRIELPKKFQEIYSCYHKTNRQGEGIASALSQKMESWMHIKVAEDVKVNKNKNTLEIGAGTLNQLKYESTQPYEIVEPFNELYNNSPYLDRVKTIYKDIDDVNINNRYDRITSVAAFEHISDLPEVIAKTCILLKERGVLRVAIPNEGSFIFRLGWRLTTGLAFRIKYKMDYGILMKYEHVNTADEIEEIIRYFFSSVKAGYFGISKKIALYRFYECSDQNTKRARDFLGVQK